MEYIKLDLQDMFMMMKLFPLYKEYEAEISKTTIEEIFPKDKYKENVEYFKRYFGRGITTYIFSKKSDTIGFVSFHIHSKTVPGYADEYHGWGHLAEIYVVKNARCLGLGKQMVNKVEEEFLKMGINKVYLTDISGNDNFWCALGFINTQKIEPNEGGQIYEKYLKHK